MVSSDFRAEARKRLQSKWGKAAIMMLAYAVCFFILGLIQNLFTEGSTLYAIFSIIVAIIEIPLGFGLLISLLKLYKDEETSAFGFLKLGFNNFKRSWAVTWYVFLKLLLPIILIIVAYIIVAIGISVATVSAVSGGGATVGSALSIIGTILLIVGYIWSIPRSYSYMMSYVIAADEENLTSKEAVNKSGEIMQGNRWKLFCLQFSFIGWAILASIVLGIGYLWLIPYIQFAMIAFYFNLNGKGPEIKAEVVPEEPKENPKTETIEDKSTDKE